MIMLIQITDFDQMDEITLASFVLWRLNWIHPFIDGNGRTAAVLCYFVLGVKSEPPISSKYEQVFLPEILRQKEKEYIESNEYATDIARKRIIVTESTGMRMNGIYVWPLCTGQAGFDPGQPG